MNAGSTLLELLIAMSLSSLIMIILFNAYALIAKNYNQVKQLSEAIANSQYALYFLKNNFGSHHKISLFAIQSDRYPNLKLIHNTEGFGLADESVLQGRVYFYTSKDSKGNSGLYFKENQKPRILIASKITALQVLYAIQCLDSKNICSYTKSEFVKDWRLVKGVALTFTVQIAPELRKQLRTYFALH